MSRDKRVIKSVEEVFHRYRLCKDCFYKNEEQIRFMDDVEKQVDMLPDEEKEALKLRYMGSSYLFDYQVYEAHLQISKDTYKRRMSRAFEVIYSSFKNAGHITEGEDE